MSAALSHAALAVAATAFGSLWEGALIAGAVWLGLRALPRLGASTRYAVWLCALVAMVLIPVLTVNLSPQSSDPASDQVIVTVAYSAATRAHAGPPVAPARGGTAPIAPEPATSVRAPAASPAAVAQKSRITIPPSFALAAGLLWLLLACARALRLLLDVRALAAIRRDARLWSSAYDYPVFLSDLVQVPIAVGFTRAAIILPASVVEQLRSEALEAIVVHEVAHLHRYDVWTNAVARAAEVFATLNPAAWFVMRRLSTEREIACDDWVVARTGAGDTFAQTLLELVTRRGTGVPVIAPSAIGGRHAIVERIERLLDSRPRRLRLSASALGGALALLAFFALVVQTVSPVMAYAQQRTAPARGATVAQAAGPCAVPNRSVRMTSFLGFKQMGFAGFPKDGAKLPEPRTLVAEFGAARVATFDLTVDAAGRPRKVAVISAPPYPGMVEHVTRAMMNETYAPALHDCKPVATTIRAAMRFDAPIADGYSIVVPAYPRGWSAAHPSACKVPTLQRSGVPAFPAAMGSMPVDAAYSTAVRVHVDAAGAVTSAAVVGSGGSKAFDDASLAAARRATYPLTDATGFKQARPPHTSLAWNAAHRSATFVSCRPLPTGYVWNTTFGKIVPEGVPGTSGVVLGRVRVE